jgi:predicted membrane protein
MDSNNRGEERREQREKWREERRRFRDEIRGRYPGHLSGSGRIWTGVLLLLIGAAAILKLEFFPELAWLYDWPTILIIVGLFIGIRHNFRGVAWFILMLIGGIFLVRHNFPDLLMYQYLWPIALIVLGLFFIFKPRRRNWHWREYVDEEKKTDDSGVFVKVDAGVTGTSESAATDEEVVDSTSVFGGSKKKVLSKNFKGGDIVNIFGGTEIDLSQADINGEVKLELTQMFGGTKLIIPGNWKLIVKNAAILGGIEDKRPNQPFDPGKVLILTGTSIFGGIEIRSY